MKRAFAGDKETILRFGQEHFQRNWIYETECSLVQDVSKCFIATENGEVIGFACFDSSAKGFSDQWALIPKEERSIQERLC